MSTVLPGTSAHSSECDPVVRVIVGEGSDAVEIPTVNGADGTPPAVEVRKRAGGTSDMSSVADILTPIEWGNGDVLGAILDAVDADSISSIGNEPVRVDIRDEVTDEYDIAHYGAISSVGAGSERGTLRFLCTDYGNFFDTVNFDASFTYGSTVIDVLRAVVDRLADHEALPPFGLIVDNGDQQLPVDLGVGTASRLTQGNNDSIRDSLSDFFTGGETEAAFEMATPKSFSSDLHTCADALDWMCSRSDGYWWVRYSEEHEGPVIVYTQQPSGGSFTSINLTENGEKGDIRVIRNNSLFQLGPRRALTVLGEKKTKREIPEENIGQYNSIPTTTIRPKVTVHHKELVGRAGENPHPEVFKTDATSIEVAKRQASKKLRELIADAAGGEIVCLPSPYIRPRSTIESRPVCNGKIVRNVDPLTYEVNETIYTITNPTVKNKTGSRMLLRCSISVSDDDIAVTEAKEVDVSLSQER